MFSELIDSIYKSETKSYENIIGIDFGSTFSYFTFVSKKLNTFNESNSKLCKEDYKCTLKDYSAIYCNAKAKYTRFGERAIIINSNKPDGVLFQYFQPLLYRKFDSSTDNLKLKALKDSDIVDITANYLRNFIKKGLSKVKLEHHRPHFFWKSNILYVITIPKICLEKDKALLKKAVVKAGIASSKDIESKVMFIPVTQASALYYDQYLHNHFKASIPQYFMVCDAGGNTVNVSIFSSMESSRLNNAFLLNESKTGLGSRSIDERFRCLLREKIARCVIKGGNHRDMDDLVNSFIKDIKPRFSSDFNEDIYFPVPYSFCLPSFFEDSTNFIVNDTIRISHDELSATVFKPVIDEVITFIKNQLDKFLVDERRLKAILLVGGFGQSPFLYKEMMNRFEGKDIGANVVLQLPQGELAACKGAASYGIYRSLLS